MSFHKDLRGADLHAPSQELIENNSGSTISKMKVVSLDGMGAAYPQIQLCDPAFLSSFGIVNDDIATGKSGYITTLGFMFNVDTSPWAVNTVLFSDAMGNLTTTQPPASNNTPVAFIVRQHATAGIMYVTALTDTILTQSVGWFTAGNSGLDSTGNFIGTNDLVDFNIRTNNLLRAKFGQAGGLTMSTNIDMGNNPIENALEFNGVKIPEANVRRVRVDPGTAEYGSVAAAVASISGSSPSNPFLVDIGPGVFTETAFSVPAYVEVRGSGIDATVLQPSNPNTSFITLANNTFVSHLLAKGANGVSGVLFDFVPSGAGTRCLLNFVRFGNSTIVFRCVDPAFSCSFNLQQCGTLSTDTFGTTIKVQSSTNPVIALIANGTFLQSTNSSAAVTFDVSGPFAGLVLNGNVSQYAASVLGTHIKLYDGASLRVTDCLCEGGALTLSVPNIGAGPSIAATGIISLTPVASANIAHPGITGAIEAVANVAGSFIIDPAASSIALSILSPDGDIYTSGNLRTRQPDNVFTDTTTLSSNASPMGLLGSGDINPPVSGTTVLVEEGLGYLQRADGSLRKVEWPDTSITVPANSTRYLYFDYTGTLQQSGSSPDNTQNIIVGRVITNATGILAIDESGPRAEHAATKVGDALRFGLGAVYSGGSVVSELGIRTLNVTAGSYYFGERHFESAGGSPITFTTFYQNGSGGYIDTVGQTVVDNSKWDDGSGTLASLGAGNYAKHSLYALGDSTGDFDSEGYFLVYSQAQYTDLTLAEQGPLPTPPMFLSEAIVPIASIIVQQGFANIVKILDERPISSARRTSVVSANTFHSNLLGLTIGDDHPQYWRNDGTHVATGDFNLGGNDITNLGTANGVVIENHHLRHQPNNADALLTSAASTLTPDLANADGVANFFSRSDHIHNVPTAIAVGLNATNANAQGSAATFSRADHIHAILSGTPSSQAPDQSNATGTSSAFARADHIHNIPTAIAVGLNANTVNGQGGNANFSRSDHTHAILSGTPSTQNTDQANAIGTSAAFARADHIHNIPTAVPVDIGNANAQGTSVNFSRADHVHKGLHSIKAGSGGAQRFGDVALIAGFGTSVVDDGSGNFTIDTLGGPNELSVSAGAGLVANYTTGKVRYDGTFTQVAASSITLTANITNGRIYVDVDGVVKQTASNTPAPPYTTVLALFSTNASSITSLTDHRTFLNQNVIRGLVGDITTILPNASALAGTTNRLADAGHTHAIATAAGITLDATTSSSEGVASSFSRSDHGHAITTGTPSQQNATNANTTGVAAALARADHLHNILTGAASQLTPDLANATGTGSALARADHLHNVPTAAPINQTIAAALSQGTAATFARSDHGHTFSTAAASQLTPDLANAVGTSTSFARADHIHNVPTAAPINQTIAAALSQGVAATFARSDHGHTFSTAAPVTLNPDVANTQGTSTSFSRADHIHNVPADTAVLISTNANTEGTSTSFARADHTHQLTATAASLDHFPQYDGSNWQAVYPETAPNPGRAYRIYDDFINSTFSGQLGWTSVVVGGQSQITIGATGSDSNHPGVVVIQAGNNAARFADLHLGTGNMFLGGGQLVVEILFNLQILTNAAFRLGLGDTNSADFQNGVYLEYNSSVSANWLLKTANGGTRTSTTSTTAATANAWHKLVITVNAAASSVSYTLDGVSLGTVTTNIPTANSVSPRMQADSLSTTNSAFWVDYYMLYQRFTTAR